MFHFKVGLNEFCLSSFYVVILVQYQVSNMSTYRQIQEIFNQLNQMLINQEDYSEKSKVKIHEQCVHESILTNYELNALCK